MYFYDIKKQFYALESLRGIAATYVVFGHAKYILFCGGSKYLENNPLVEQSIMEIVLFSFTMLFSYAISAVILFFIISGFSIDYSISRIKNKKFHSVGSAIKIFYIRRLVRIYIPYIVAVLVSILLLYFSISINDNFISNGINSELYQKMQVAIYNSQSFEFIIDSLFYNFYGLIVKGDILNNAIFIGYNQPFWSLNIEVFFYFLAPVLLLFIANKILFILMMVGILVGIGDYQFDYINSYLVLFIKFLPIFLIGVFLRRFINKIILFLNEKKIHPLVLFFLFLSGYFVSFYLDYIDMQYLNKITVALSFIFLILFMFSENRLSLKLSSLFNNLGINSYTIYLIHFPVLIFILAIYTNITGVYEIKSLVLFIFGAIIAIIVSKVVYNFGEKQTQIYLSKTR